MARASKKKELGGPTADRLPIYRVSSGDTSTPMLIELSKRILRIGDNFQMSTRGTSRVLRSGHRVIELASESGGIWAADESQLWNPSLRPKLVAENEAASAAEKALRELRVLPKLQSPFRFGRPVIGGTRLATKAAKTARRENRRLDIQVTYPVLVGDIPMIGGGSDFQVTLGDQGQIIAYSGVWRTPKHAFDAKLISRDVADQQFRALTQELTIDSFDASLAYYSEPSFRVQDFLYPVYVYRGIAKFGKRFVPLRQIIVPATEFGTPIVVGQRQPQLRRKKPADYRRSTRKGRRDANKGMARRSFASAPTRPWEAGTSWIGLSGGLAGSQQNAQGFVDEWANAGWHIDFNWGDGNAWESDWTSNDDNYVDNADFVFYTGHANMNGWVLAKTGGDGWLDFTETGASPRNPGDLWGQSDLEWAIIAACGPLQDDVISAGGGDVFARWDGAFDGMHTLLGYGAITNDNTDEGRKVAQYCKGGSTVINAWFRTAQEIQPSTNGAKAPDGPTVWVGAMWVGKDGADPFNDHAWDYGSVSADPVSPTWYSAMWTTC
jgi:Family of unknown function (DUF6345)